MENIQAQPRKLFEVTPSMSFHPAQADQHVGGVQILFTMRNTTTIAAVMPFMSFSYLGLRVVAQQDWILQKTETGAGKRLTKFLSMKHQTLEPGETLSPCALRLDVSPRCGGLVTVSHGAERSVHDTSDIRVPCHVGAGNFAPESATVVVSGIELGRLVRSAMELNFLIRPGSPRRSRDWFAKVS